MNPRADHRKGGFTLLELITVMAIMALLVGLTIPAMISLQQSENLTSAGKIVSDQINLARQLASTNNRTIQLRLIQMPGVTSGYNAIQLWRENLTGTSVTPVPVAFSRLVLLPQTVVAPYSSSAGLSELLTTSSLVTGTMQVSSAANAPYIAFEISPAGVVTPSLNMTNSYLTVIAANNASSGTVPANYVSVQIDPLTATPLVYRP